MGAVAAVIYLLGAIEFAVGRPNLIGVLIALELMLLAIGLIMIELSSYLDDLAGAAIALLILPIAGAESAVALSLLVAFYPMRLNVLSGMSRAAGRAEQSRAAG